MLENDHKLIYVPHIVELYEFLRYTNRSQLEKYVFDCGAGGGDPGLALFAINGYKAKGIDISKEAVNNAMKYARDSKINFKISIGDMRSIPESSNSISFLYSLYSIFHLTKNDVKIAMDEIYRVLSPRGLCFINFVSVDDSYYGKGESLGNNQFNQQEGNGMSVHSYYEDNEPDSLFLNFELIFKEKRIRTIYRDNLSYDEVYLLYLAQKK